MKNIMNVVNQYLAFISLAILVLIPLVLLLIKSVLPEGSFTGLDTFLILLESKHQKILWNSLLLGFGVIAGSTLIAGPLAYIMARTDLQRHRWIDVVLIIPFMTPPYIGAMGWILSMQPNGYAVQMFPFLSGITPLFFSYFGMVLVMSLHLFPFIYLIMRNTLANIGGRLEEAAIVHGGSFSYRLRKVIFLCFYLGIAWEHY